MTWRLAVAVSTFAVAASASAQTTPRPPHVLTRHSEPPTLFARWQPDWLGASRALEVAHRASTVAAAMGSSSGHVAAAVDVASEGVDVASSAASTHCAPAATPFRLLQGNMPWPVSQRRLNAGFGPRPRNGGRTDDRHTGWSFRLPGDASMNAVATGVVAFRGQIPGMGNVVVLDHGDLFHTVYAGLREVTLAVGDRVDAGDTVGVGGGGTVWPGEVYFELRDRGVPVDPANWLR